jgi:hypothetical protein
LRRFAASTTVTIVSSARHRKAIGRSHRGTRRSWRLEAARKCRWIRSAARRSGPDSASLRTSTSTGRRAACSRCSHWSFRPVVSSVRDRLAPSIAHELGIDVDLAHVVDDDRNRRPSRLERTWLSNVVLPAPRKPESTVTGRRFEGLAVSSMASLTVFGEEAPGLDGQAHNAG